MERGTGVSFSLSFGQGNEREGNKMKKLWTVVFCSLLCLFLCGCDNDRQRRKQSLDWDSPDQLIQDDEKLTQFVLSGDCFPEGFLLPELEGYGRIISSSESAEEAQTIAREHFTNEDYVVVVDDVKDETELFFGLSVEWAARDPQRAWRYAEDVVSFRTEIFDHDTQTIYTNDTSLIEGILNYIYYEDMYQIVGSKVIFAELTQTQDCFSYSIYYTKVVYGDWGIQDELFVFRDVLTIDKDSRIMEKDSQQLRAFFCDVSPAQH